MHKSVLLNECIEYLNLKEDSIIVDCTLGYGGHSSEILKRIPKGHLYAFDQDSEALQYAEKRLSEVGSNFTLIHSNFKKIKEELDHLDVEKVDGILFDLGFSSPQIDDETRGFSFMRDGKLDMRMDRRQKRSAYEVVNTYSESELVRIFFQYGEEKFSKSIAKAIVKNRPINKTMELVSIIQNSVPKKYAITKHPERVIFQAIRIEVNEELDVLKDVLPIAIDFLNQKGRICVITFHSLEDRIVKQYFKKMSEIDDLVKGLPVIPDAYKPKIKLINKKPILPSEDEKNENSRSKSAKLRVIERV